MTISKCEVYVTRKADSEHWIWYGNFPTEMVGEIVGGLAKMPDISSILVETSD